MSPASKAPAAASKSKASAKSAPRTAKPEAPAASKSKAAAKPKSPAKPKADPELKAKIAAAEAPEKAPRKPRASRAKAPKVNDVAALQALILARLDDDKAEDVVVIDLKDKSPMADYIVIASGRSQRHVAAMADHLTRSLKEGGHGRAKVEGLPQADWVLIDAGDIIVHLFRPEVRAFYQIEKIWSVEPGKSGHLVSST
jgi:ribosome-associated protein